jgi:hypothetical protein
MNRLATIRVSLLRAVFAVAIAGIFPAVAAGAPLTLVAAADGTLQGQVGGTFEFDNDVALFEFVLGEGTFDFMVATTSYAAGGFDPVLSLFTVPADGVISLYTYPGTEAGEVLSASVDDQVPGENFDARLSLSLSQGSYILALTQTGNFVHEDFTFDWDDPAFQCAAGIVCDLPIDSPLRSFAASVTVRDINAAPVPEPGTLSLLALGSLATAAVGRRRNRRVMTPQ